MIHRSFPDTRLTKILAVAVLLVLFGYQTHTPAVAAVLPQQQTALALDNVAISLSTTFLPSPAFTASARGSASQVATSVSWKPFSELTITAVPFGTKPGTESVPIAQPGGVEAYTSALRMVRLAQGGEILPGPTANLFGQTVVGQATVVNLNLDGPVLKPTLIVEWVVEAGKRLWIIRASQEQALGIAGKLSSSALTPLGHLIVTSSALNNPTSLGSQPDGLAGPIFPTAPSAGNIPTPTWWSGDCDSNTYYAGSGGLSSHRLGAIYLGMPACGPRPFADHAPDVLAHLFPQSWGVLEWECVELSMRFLYLAYGVHPYSANGNTVVWNYSSSADGGSLEKVGNGTPNAAPQPGDILSYDGPSSVGHTSVVMSSEVDGTGNGTVTVIEQNNTIAGSTTMNVVNWYVEGNPGSVSGWLHQPIKLPMSELMLPLIMMR